MVLTESSLADGGQGKLWLAVARAKPVPGLHRILIGFLHLAVKSVLRYDSSFRQRNSPLVKGPYQEQCCSCPCVNITQSLDYGEASVLYTTASYFPPVSQGACLSYECCRLGRLVLPAASLLTSLCLVVV